MVYHELKSIPKKQRYSKQIDANEYILNGKLVKWKGKKYDVLSPIKIYKGDSLKEVILGKYPLMDSKTALKILNCAYESYSNGEGFWPTMNISSRIKYFEKLILELNKVRDEVINTLMWEIGKNYIDSQKEFDRTVEYIQKSIDKLKQKSIFSNDFIEEDEILGKIKRSPLGIVLCMGPYNYPLNESFTTLIPALLMGNVVIFKPPKKGVLLHYKIIKIFAKIFPKGVFNVIYGEGEEIIKPIMETGKISVLAFIGSSKVANIIQRYHPKPNRLKIVLGLEAKNAGIVLEDADIDNAVKECILGSLSFNGQRCTALKILFIHEKIVDKFNQKFVEKVNELKVGMPYENAFITPVLSDNLKFYNELVYDAINKGAKILNNVEKDFETIFYPKVLYPVNYDMKIAHLEQFGPIVPIIRFSHIDEPIKYITESDYGQQCSIFSDNPKTIGLMIDKLINQVSRININSQCQRGPDSFPFTGRKDSAVGTLSISDALKVFSIRTLVSAKLTDKNKEIYKKIIDKNHSQFLKNDIFF